MTSCSDILRCLSRERLVKIALEHARYLARIKTDEELIEALARSVGARMLEVVAGLEPEEIGHICDALDLDPSELARLCAPPQTRGDCVSGLRPCPYRSCRYHLFRSCEPSCALDVADEGGTGRPEVASILGCTGERVRQIEVEAARKAGGRANLVRAGFYTERPTGDVSPEGGTKPAVSLGGSVGPRLRVAEG